MLQDRAQRDGQNLAQNRHAAVVTDVRVGGRLFDNSTPRKG